MTKALILPLLVLGLAMGGCVSTHAVGNDSETTVPDNATVHALLGHQRKLEWIAHTFYLNPYVYFTGVKNQGFSFLLPRQLYRRKALLDEQIHLVRCEVACARNELNGRGFANCFAGSVYLNMQHSTASLLRSAYSRFVKDEYCRLPADNYSFPPAEQAQAHSTEAYMSHSQNHDLAFAESGCCAQVRPQTFDVDLLHVSSDIGPNRYVDFSITPHFDPVAERWSVEFSTTNALCGIVATTNRVFTAPEGGYQPRVAVSQEEYECPTFTLYLRTRSPSVYAMIAPLLRHHFCLANGDMPVFNFCLEFNDIAINLTGSRTFTFGREADSVWGPDDVRILVEEHRYPPVPDIAKILAIRELRRQKEEMLGAFARRDLVADIRLSDLWSRRRKGENVDAEIAVAQKEIDFLRRNIRSIKDELERLDQSFKEKSKK